ncbi:MAG: hypothetical protein KA198_07740, partial [Chitinophagaceae bacterium]|nr:hypothetical protein [Chitinophagaceae bacterium]
DKSGVDEIIFMPRIFSLDFLLNFCVMAKVEKQTGIFTDNHIKFWSLKIGVLGVLGRLVLSVS